MKVKPDKLKPWKSLAYTDSPAPWRRLACAMLLGGALGAYAGCPDDVEWVRSDVARPLAELVDLPHWPPSPRELASRRELARRAGDGLPVAESVGALRIRSRNPADRAKARPWRAGPAVVDAVEWSYFGMDGPD